MPIRAGFLKCKVYPGMFDSEYNVVIHLGGEDFTGSWVGNRNVIITKGEVTTSESDDSAAQGLLRVAVREELPDGMLIQLPAEAFNGQLSFVVPPEVIEYDPPGITEATAR